MTDEINSTLASGTMNEIVDSILDVIYYTECVFNWTLIQSIYVCVYLRKTTTSQGMTWYRSFITGFLLVFFPRLLYSSLINVNADEYSYFDYLSIFTPVWLSVNLFPFDFVFRILNIKTFQTVLTILQSHTEGLVFLNNMYLVSQVKNKVEHQILIIILVTLAPVMIQGLDFILSGDNRILMTPIAYLKRVLFLQILSFCLVTPALIWEEPPIDLVNVLYVLPILLDILRIIDLIHFDFNNYMFIDYIFSRLGDSSPKYIPRLVKKSNNQNVISTDF